MALGGKLNLATAKYEKSRFGALNARGRGDRNWTHIYGFGDRYTNRCTTPL